MSAYRFLEEQFKNYYVYKDIDMMLMWDGATMMPRGAAESRGEQSSLIQISAHNTLKNPHVHEAIAKAESETLDPWQTANLREMKRVLVHETALDPKIIAEHTKLTTESEMVWRDARKNNDFAAMEPYLKKIFDLRRIVGEAKAEKLNTTPYEALVDEFDPGSDCKRIDLYFDDLAAFLPGIIDQIIEKQAKNPALPLNANFPVEAQRHLGLGIMQDFNFNFDRGRLDTSTHPFCGGTHSDVRITTRYKENEFFSAMLGIIHETGHALYEQGQPDAYQYQPVGKYRGMGVHESQSLFYEKQIGRSNDFMAYMYPKIKAAFNGQGAAWEQENLLKLNHQVKRSLIRVEADEVTYPLHIILRYRIEKGIIEKKYDVRDMQEIWNQGMKELLGVTVPHVHDGCLQDIHWPEGWVGYFPSYTMGALISAQLFQAYKRENPNVNTDMRQGKFDGILSWLREKIHKNASFYDQYTLIEKATGKPLSTEDFKTHVKERYLTA